MDIVPFKNALDVDQFGENPRGKLILLNKTEFHDSQFTKSF